MKGKIILWIVVLISLVGIVSAISSEGLVSYWDMDFDEDDKVSDNDPTASGCNNIEGNGALGNSTNCNLNKITYDMSKVNINPRGNFTQVIWVNWTTPPVDTGISGIWSLGKTGIFGGDLNNSNIYWNKDITNDPIGVWYGDTVGTDNLSNNFNNINNLVWYMIAVTYDGSILTISGNKGGTFQITDNLSISSILLDKTGIFYLGGRGDGNVAQLKDVNIDEVSIWNRSLSQDELKEIYNSGIPLALSSYVPSGSTPGEGVVVGLETPTDGEFLATTTINFTYSVNSSNSSLDYCNLYIDGVLNVTNTTPVNNTINSFFNVGGLVEQTYNWTVRCADVYPTWGNSTNRSLTIDTTEPTIFTDLSGNDKVVIALGNLTASINVTDPNLYSLLINDSVNGIIANITDINRTFWNYTLNLNVSTGYNLGANNITIQVADGHTAKKIGKWGYEKDLLSKKIKFDFSTNMFDNEYISIKPTGFTLLDTFTTEKLEDRYIYYYNPIGNPNQITFVVESNDFIDIMGKGKSKYNAWLVFPNLLKWTDFNIQDATGNEKYHVKRLDYNKVEVKITNIDERDVFVFESSGDLNVNQQTYTWYYINSTVGTPENSTEFTTTTYNLNLTKGSASITTDAVFYYDSNTHFPTKTAGSTMDQYVVNVNQSKVTNFTANITTIWHYNATYNDNFENNTEEINTSVFEMRFGVCGLFGLINKTAINFTVLSETDESPIASYVFDGLMRAWDVNYPTHVENFTFYNTTYSNDNAVCSFPSWKTYKVDYETLFTKPLYSSAQALGVEELNYKNVTIYLVPTQNTTAITVGVVDENDDPLENYIVEVWKYRLGFDDFILIDVEECDLDGKVKFDIDIVDKEYKFVVKNTDGDIVFTQSKQKIINTEYTLRVILGTSPELINLKIGRLKINLDATRLNQTFYTSWEDIDVEVSEIKFKLYKSNLTETEDIYENSSTLGTGLITYEMNKSESASYVWDVSVVSIDDGEEYFYDSITIDVREAWDVFGEGTLFMAFLFIGTLIFIGASMGIEGAIGMSILGLVIFTAMGFIMLSATAVISLITALIIYLIKSRRSQ